MVKGIRKEVSAIIVDAFVDVTSHNYATAVSAVIIADLLYVFIVL